MGGNKNCIDLAGADCISYKLVHVVCRDFIT